MSDSTCPAYKESSSKSSALPNSSAISAGQRSLWAGGGLQFHRPRLLPLRTTRQMTWQRPVAIPSGLASRPLKPIGQERREAEGVSFHLRSRHFSEGRRRPTPPFIISSKHRSANVILYSVVPNPTTTRNAEWQMMVHTREHKHLAQHQIFEENQMPVQLFCFFHCLMNI